MNKLKDILYDISDILVAFFIISIVVVVVGWQVSSTLSYSAKNLGDKTSTPPQPIEEISPLEPSTETIVTPSEDKDTIIEPVVEPAKQAIEVTPAKEPTTPKPTPKPVSKKITVVIPSGSPGIKIAKILESAGLIKSSSDFVKRSSELKMDSKLKSGTYTINTSDSIDDMIYKIAGKKK